MSYEGFTKVVPGYVFQGETSHFTVQWENGVFMSYPVKVKTKADAFAYIDRIMQGTRYPDSIHAQILEDGQVVWSQFGSLIEVNR